MSKRKPIDATMRNVQALNKRIKKLEDKVEDLIAKLKAGYSKEQYKEYYDSSK